MKYRDFKKIDTKLNLIASKISFMVINPTNIWEEKNKFFSQEHYNPQFKYARYRSNLELLKKRLEGMKTDESVFGTILEKQRLYLIKRILMLKNLGREEFTACAADVYGKPSEELVEKAKGMVTMEENDNEAVLNSGEIASLLRDALTKYGLEDWSISEKDMPAMAAVRPHKKALFIKKDALFSKGFIDRLIVHEIGTHVLRSENGRRQPFKIFWRGLPDYLGTEEGLAVVNEELHGYLNKRILRSYIGRVLAIDLGQNYSFNEVFERLSRYFIAESAFNAAVRAKRGISDTSKPGGLTKDYLYLDGYFRVKKYIQEGGTINKLYYGRIGIEHVPLLDDIPGLKKPSVLLNL